MPVIENVKDFAGDGDTWIANVSTSVGTRGINSPADVLLINNLLNIANFGLKFRNYADMPLAGTSITAKLPEAIAAFQKKYNSLKQAAKVTVDGRISPARGNAFFRKNQVWTIVALNKYAVLSYITNPLKSSLITLSTPYLEQILDRKDIAVSDFGDGRIDVAN